MPKRDNFKVPDAAIHRRKIGQNYNKQNEVFNKQTKSKAIQRQQKSFFERHKGTIFTILLFTVLLFVILGLTYYLNFKEFNEFFLAHWPTKANMN